MISILNAILPYVCEICSQRPPVNKRIWHCERNVAQWEVDVVNCTMDVI